MTQRIHVTASLPDGASVDAEDSGNILRLSKLVIGVLLCGGDVTRATWRETRQSSHNAGCLLCNTQFEHAKVVR